MDELIEINTEQEKRNVTVISGLIQGLRSLNDELETFMLRDRFLSYFLCGDSWWLSLDYNGANLGFRRKWIHWSISIKLLVVTHATYCSVGLSVGTCNTAELGFSLPSFPVSFL